MDIDTFKAVSHPFRKHIIEQLADGELHTTPELAAGFQMTKAAISQHFKILRTAHLVTEVKMGREKSYSLNPQGITEVLRWAEHFQSFWTTRMQDLNEYLEKTHGQN